MLTLLHLLACIGNERKQTTFEKWGFWLFIKVFTFCILALGFCYGGMFGTALGVTISGILHLESAILCYPVIAASSLGGLFLAILPAYFFHFTMSKLANLAN